MSLPGWAHLAFEDIRVGAKIGGGGSGIIYEGEFQGEKVAIKTLFNPRVTADVKQEYLDELQVMSKLSHSNIVEFKGACLTSPNLCFVMELCTHSLFDLLHTDRIEMSAQEGMRIAIDVSSAMEYLHALTPVIIHRDLKSHNVLRDNNGVYKLCDFGLVTCNTAQAGTPAYMAPELLMNKHFNKSVDVYSFGILLWEIFSGEVPFHMVDVTDIRQRVIAGNRPSIPSFGFSKKCSPLINQCWYVLYTIVIIVAVICLCLCTYLSAGVRNPGSGLPSVRL